MNAAKRSAGGDELLFLPLGGAGEIGMNLSLYGYRGKWLMVDLGVTFGGEENPGADLIVPDISFIAARRRDLAGIVLTHAHEDHLGAVPHLWEMLGGPVYGTPFALALLRRKLIEAGLESRVKLVEVPPGGGVTVGPFTIDYIPVAHSIPETHVLAIRTKAGTVLHASDWRLDPDPLVGPVTDEAALRRLGEDGVLAMICDSTNVFVDGRAGSEGKLRKSLIELVGRCKQRVALACFASNVARIETIAAAAAANGRYLGLVGRSLWNIATLAQECGYLAEAGRFLGEHDAAYLPRDEVLLAVTGSQGEAQAALARIAAGDHPQIELEAGDTVIFSSRVIPGNEKAIARVQNGLARRGIEIITADDHFVHVSGHPARDELAEMYRWVKPPLLVPIHGETRHLIEHGRFARECQVPHVVVAENGAVVRLHPAPAEVVDHVTTGRFAVDGKRLVPLAGDVMRARRRMGAGGIAVATVVLDGDGRLLAEPRLLLPGLLDGVAKEDEEAIVERAISAMADAVDRLSDAARESDADVATAARRALRRSLRDAFGRRPVAEIQVVRV